jgi:hypothetical protein
MQDLYVALTDLRNSLRTASDESILTSPAWSVYKVIKASGDATSDLEGVREMLKKILGQSQIIQASRESQNALLYRIEY